MKKTDRIETVASLLSRALSLSSGVNDHRISEARVHMRAALERVQKHNTVEHRKDAQQQKLHDQWWGTVTAGAAKASMAQTAHISEGHTAAEAYSRALKQIDFMLQEEYEKLRELENPPEEEPKQVEETPIGLLRD